MIQNLRHVGIPIRDIELALGFYVGLLGFKVICQKTIEGEYAEKLFGISKMKLTYIKLQLDSDTTLLELHFYHCPTYMHPMTMHHFAFSVTDLDMEYKRLSDSGIQFVSEPLKAPDSNCRIAFCFDPNGNMVELVEENK